MVNFLGKWITKPAKTAVEWVLIKSDEMRKDAKGGFIIPLRVRVEPNRLPLFGFHILMVTLFFLCMILSGCDSLVNREPTESAEIVTQADNFTQMSEESAIPVNEVDELIAALAGTEEKGRKEAVNHLVAMGSRAVEPLIAILQERSSTVKIGALEALGRIGDPRAVEAVIVLLQDDFSLVRAEAAEALGIIGDVRAVEPLIIALKDEDSWVQQNAAKALGIIGDPRAVNALIEALEIRSSFVRENAIISLGQIGDPRALEPLFVLLKNGDVLDQNTVKKSLVLIGAPAIDGLIKTLQEDDPTLQKLAVTALGEIREARAVEPLITYFKTADDRRPVYQALVSIGEPAVDALIDTLQDDDLEVAGYAAIALGEIKDTRAVEPLIAVLSDKDFYYKDWAAKALGEIGDPRAILPLIASMKGNERLLQSEAINALMTFDAQAVEPLIAALKNQDEGIRRCAVVALGKINDPRAVEPLIVVLTDKAFYVRIEVPLVLAEFDDPRVVDALISALQDTKWSRVRINAADALGVVKDTRAVEPLITALHDQDAYVRRQAALALGQIQDLRAVEPLIAAIKDAEPVARMAVAEALSEFNDPRAFDTLANALQQEDLAAIAGAYQYFIRRGESGSETLLIDALNEYGGIRMGEDYLNCGNAALKKAVEEWAKSKGYSITTSSKAIDSPRWGSAK